MCDFRSAALLRTSRYAGRFLPPHLVIAGLGEKHFRRWLTLFRTVVKRVCPPDVAAIFMARALRIAHSFRLAIALSRGENTVQIEPIAEDSPFDSDRGCDPCSAEPRKPVLSEVNVMKQPAAS